MGKPELGKVGRGAAGEGVICFFGVFIDEDDGFFVAMEDVGCTAGDLDTNEGLLVMRFFIAFFNPCPWAIIGEAALWGVGGATKGGGAIPFAGRATVGIIESRVVKGPNEGDFPIP